MLLIIVLIIFIYKFFTELLPVYERESKKFITIYTVIFTMALLISVYTSMISK